MKTKKTFLKMGMFGLIMGYLSLSFTSAKIYKINLGSTIENIYDERYITENMMYVHFADNGNDFGGILYFSNIGEEGNCEDCEPKFTVSTRDIEGINRNDRSDYQGKVYECKKQVKGLYYNAQRGERLWPLDNNTASVLNNVSFTGGIYTNCSDLGYFQAISNCSSDNNRCNDGTNGTICKSYEECIDDANRDFKSDGRGYFGSVTHEYSGQTMTLVMGVKYDASTEFISIQSGSELAPTFSRLENKYPVGFIYDYNGGLGLAGCRFTAPNDYSMKELFREYLQYESENGLGNLFSYDYNSGTVVYDDPRGLLGSDYIKCDTISEANTLLKIIIEGVVGLSNKSTTGTDKNTIYGTRGNSTDTKMQQFATKNINNSTMMNYVRKRAELLCRGKWTGSVCDANGHTKPFPIICYNGDFSLYSCDVRGHTLIIKNGDIYIPGDDHNHINSTGNYDIYLLSGDLRIQENTGYTDYKFVFDKNGYYTNVSIDDFKNAVTGYNYDGNMGVAVASTLKGNFIVNGRILGADFENNFKEHLENKYFIYGKVVSKDTIDNLEYTFSRRCNRGNGSDGYPCPRFSDENTTNDYQNASLIIIDQNFPSPMLNS